MLYGHSSYEGSPRDCSCGHFTNVHSNCDICEKAICESCEIYVYSGRAEHYCSTDCRSEVICDSCYPSECFCDLEPEPLGRVATFEDLEELAAEAAEAFLPTERKAA